MAEVKGKNELIQFFFRLDAPIMVENIPLLLQKYKEKLTFDPKGTPTFRYRYKKYGMVEKDERLLLDLAEELLEDMQEFLLNMSQNKM